MKKIRFTRYKNMNRKQRHKFWTLIMYIGCGVMSLITLVAGLYAVHLDYITSIGMAEQYKSEALIFHVLAGLAFISGLLCIKLLDLSLKYRN